MEGRSLNREIERNKSYVKERRKVREEREERREKVTVGNKKKIGLTFMLQ